MRAARDHVKERVPLCALQPSHTEQCRLADVHDRFLRSACAQIEAAFCRCASTSRWTWQDVVGIQGSPRIGYRLHVGFGIWSCNLKTSKGYRDVRYAPEVVWQQCQRMFGGICRWQLQQNISISKEKQQQCLPEVVFARAHADCAWSLPNCVHAVRLLRVPWRPSG